MPGSPSKVALAAVMRQLILLANALLKANRSWAPKPAWSNRMLLDHLPVGKAGCVVSWGRAVLSA
jgi:hypothetical protein